MAKPLTPEPNAPGSADAFKPVSRDEAKKYEKYVGKPFVPKGDEKWAKKFFYRVVSIIPYIPADQNLGVGVHGLKFLLQKYDRNKTQQVSVNDGKGGKVTVEDNVPVEGHRMTDDGFWECIDDMASLTMDVRKFAEAYEADKVDDSD